MRDHASWVAWSVGSGTVWKWSYTHTLSQAKSPPGVVAVSACWSRDRMVSQWFSGATSVRS